MKRLVVALCLVIAGFGGVGVAAHGSAVAASGGMRDAAHACQHSGYLTLQGGDGTRFRNEGQCVSYAARGGFIPGVTACTVTSTTGCLTFNNATIPSYFGTGNTITLTGVTSFVDACPTGDCFLNQPNTLATGGGTYVVTGSSGAVISQGIYRIANTAGTFEGLAALQYLDGNDHLAASCVQATGLRNVTVQATFIDTTTGRTQGTGLQGRTGSLANPPIGLVNIFGDLYDGTVPTSALTITC